MVPEANPPRPFVTSHSRESSSSREWLALSHGSVRLVKVILFRNLRPVRNYPATRAKCCEHVTVRHCDSILSVVLAVCAVLFVAADEEGRRLLRGTTIFHPRSEEHTSELSH